MTDKNIQAVVIGASGYTGAELLRILKTHPNVDIVALVAESNAGKEIEEIYSHFKFEAFPPLVKLNEVDLSQIDVAFCCLPHGASQDIIKSLPKHLKIIDLSADFRIKNANLYAAWYAVPHEAPEILEESVYGLTEIYHDQIKNSRVVACPGCYPTSALLPTIPLVQSALINPWAITVDSKSGMTGAGRSLRTGNLFCEMNENIKPYGMQGHRHTVEMEQELTNASEMDEDEEEKQIRISFNPQVVPVSRGIVSTIHVELIRGIGFDDLKRALLNFYKDSPFVHIAKNDEYVPCSRDVAGTNNCHIGVYESRIPGRAVIVCAIDNLTKGSSGQAVQNMNIMYGLDETTGLTHLPVFP